jgi:predicted small secreted protein
MTQDIYNLKQADALRVLNDTIPNNMNVSDCWQAYHQALEQELYTTIFSSLDHKVKPISRVY